MFAFICFFYVKMTSIIDYPIGFNIATYPYNIRFFHVAHVTNRCICLHSAAYFSLISDDPFYTENKRLGPVKIS